MSAANVSKRKMSITAIVGSIILVAMIVWGTVTFIQVQGGNARSEVPHKRYSDVTPWPYDIPWAGGRSNWFNNLNYTNLPLGQQLPEDLLNHLDDVVFYVSPEDPPQLWRSGSYDGYDGSGWRKTSRTQVNFSSSVITRAEAEAIGNEIYTVVINVTAGPSVGSVELPTLFPSILVIEDSFTTGHIENGTYQPDAESRLISYDLETDDYGTLLFSPLIQAPTGENVLISYEVTYESQDLQYIATNALTGDAAPPDIANMYGSPALTVDLTQRVIDNITQFEGVGSNAYETAMIVANYFQTKFSLLMNQSQILERPPENQEVTDWFLERGGGLPMDFATAYCVFMRYLGIPARMVYGYAVGDPEGGYRTIRVRHMMFWAEVFVPLNDVNGGQWVQVIPLPLPPDMGGSEVPENTEAGNVQLWVFTDLPQGWVVIGHPFTLSAMMLVNGIPVTRGEQILFHDQTDSHLLGVADIVQGKYLPLANLTYTYDEQATPGPHNITATFQGPNFEVSNYTIIYVVAQPNPLTMSEIPERSVLASTIDVDLQLGLDNYTALWEDTVHVHGVMTVGGQPVDGSTLVNNQIQIMWDDAIVGNATIQSDGSYQYDIFVGPTDPLMSVGTHEVWSSYAGEYTPQGIPILLPARSEDNSTVDVKGRISISLTVTPTTAYRGTSIHYDGTAELLNGTPLRLEWIGIFFGGTYLTSVRSNITGGFSYDYTIPSDHPIGVFAAQVNWSSTMVGILGNWSNSVDVDIQVNGADITITSTPSSPDPVHPFETITISGYLTDKVNGSGLVGKTVDIWWYNGTSYKIGSVTTGTDGYYEFNYVVPGGYLGSVNYWSEFVSTTTGYEGATSTTMSIQVVPWPTDLSLSVSPSPAHPDEDITINGALTVPGQGGNPLSNGAVTIWWQNSTGSFNLTVQLTNATGLYSFVYHIPLNHEFGTVLVWAEFVSPWLEYEDSTSSVFSLTVTNYTTSLSIFSNRSYYHLNETAYIWGRLTFENGTPIAGHNVTLYWINSTGSFSYPLATNSSGWFNFYYALDPAKDSVENVTVTVEFISWTRLHSDATASISPLPLQLYQLDLAAALNASQYHQDEALLLTGTLTFHENGAGIAGETIYVYYRNSMGLFQYLKVTNSSGGFSFQYNFTLNDTLGAIYVWAEYNSSNQLWADAQSANRTATVILYSLSLTTFTNSTSYHLNETIHVYGQLTFQHNGTAIVGESVTIWMLWNNGTQHSFAGYVTNATGYYNFYYNCSVTKDSAATITIWAKYVRTNVLWDNASSLPGKDVDLILYPLTLTLSSPSPIYLDEPLVFTGQLTHQGGSPPLASQTVNIYILQGSDWVLLTSAVTNSTGHFVVSVSGALTAEGTYYFKANYSSTNPLNADAETPTSITVDAQRYPIFVDIWVTPTTVKLNESVLIQAQLTFGNNASAVVGETVLLHWYNGTDYVILSAVTNGSGFVTLNYSDLEGHTVWTGIEVYATFAGTWLLGANSSVHVSVILEQWLTLITGFTTYGQASFYILDYIHINGTLYYDLPGPDKPFAYVDVTILLDGNPVGTVTTLWNGTFDAFWRIPDDASEGSHQLSVAFMSPYSWIADYETSPTTVVFNKYDLVWTFDATPQDPVYLTEMLSVSGTVYLSNGTPLANEEVTLYWLLSGATTSTIIAQFSTAPDGSFSYAFSVGEDTATGPAQIWAYCAPTQPYINSGASTHVNLNISAIPVDLNIAPYPTLFYRGERFRVTGHLAWGNGTGDDMVGYSVGLYINGELMAANMTGSDGSFILVFDFNWTYPVGAVPTRIAFLRPSIAFEETQTGPVTVEIHDRITITLDSPTVSMIVFGETLTISGVVNNAHAAVAGVPLIVLIDGSRSSFATGNSLPNGTFSLSLVVSDSLAPGDHNFSVAPDSDYYELSESVAGWDIAVYIGSDLSVYVPSAESVTRGENFTVQIRLLDQYGQSVVGIVTVYLNDTALQSIEVDSTTWASFELTVPTSWSESGYYFVKVEYAGDRPNYINGSSAVANTPIHVFANAEVVLDSPSGDTIAVGTSLVISGTLVDDSASAFPVAGRTLTITVNGQSSTVITDQDGRFSVVAVDRTLNGTYSIRITLSTSTGTDITVSSFTVLAQANTGGNMQLADLLIPGIALAAAVVAVLLYLYFVRGYFRGRAPTVGIDIAGKLRNIKRLADAGKYDAAVSLAYRTFEQMCGIKTGDERKSSETSREYLERVVKSLPVDPATVEQFVELYEEARFSHHQVTREKYEDAIRIFTDLYPRIEISPK